MFQPSIYAMEIVGKHSRNIGALDMVTKLVLFMKVDRQPYLNVIILRWGTTTAGDS